MRYTVVKLVLFAAALPPWLEQQLISLYHGARYVASPRNCNPIPARRCEANWLWSGDFARGRCQRLSWFTHWRYLLNLLLTAMWWIWLDVHYWSIKTPNLMALCSDNVLPITSQWKLHEAANLGRQDCSSSSYIRANCYQGSPWHSDHSPRS